MAGWEIGKEDAHYLPTRSDIVLDCSTIRAIFGRPRRWQCGLCIPLVIYTQWLINNILLWRAIQRTCAETVRDSYPVCGLTNFICFQYPSFLKAKRGRDGRGGETTWMRNMMWSFWAPDSQWVVKLRFVCTETHRIDSVSFPKDGFSQTRGPISSILAKEWKPLASRRVTLEIYHKRCALEINRTSWSACTRREANSSSTGSCLLSRVTAGSVLCYTQQHLLGVTLQCVMVLFA